ncbi:CBO0543 family protein [Tumebacillus flagellatus]|uniref:Uncharacterized protein n=1 Tax=Tumebacillus flagellatus TaxID=1157490 RepID=A0A074LWI3_9BACL|nr:CBO0543 family protein [Tumebacillus flagellatus]KEO85239.1 hypothetical protein EL26_01390 [Tumebacillus flagellatus]
MYFVGLFFLCWLVFIWKADKNRARELYGVVIYTSFLGLLTDLIMVHYQLWSYKGLPCPMYTIPLTLDFGIYPVVAYLFAQTLPQSWGRIVRKTLFWTLFSVLFEFVTLRTGNMFHHQWWSLWLSLCSDIVIYLSIAAVYRFYRPAYVGNN